MSVSQSRQASRECRNVASIPSVDPQAAQCRIAMCIAAGTHHANKVSAHAAPAFPAVFASAMDLYQPMKMAAPAPNSYPLATWICSSCRAAVLLPSRLKMFILLFGLALPPLLLESVQLHLATSPNESFRSFHVCHRRPDTCHFHLS